MTKERLNELLDYIGGIEGLIEVREELMGVICSIEDFIELEAKISLGVEVDEEEIEEKIIRLTSNMIGLANA